MDKHAQYAKLIEENGRAVQGVWGDNPFCYTIGNHSKNLPELLLIGPFSPPVITAMLNHISDDMLKTGIAPAEGELDIGGNFPLMVRKCGEIAKSVYTIQVGQYYDTEDYGLLQIMICDPFGRFPLDPEIEPAYKVEMP